MRYIAVFALILAQSATALAPASADTYPSRQVRIVVGFPAGSAADITARAVRGRVLTISCLDNLVKGASGAAVQNFNWMYGFSEMTALW